MSVLNILLFLVGGALLIEAERVLFPYGEKFSSVDINDIPEDEQALYAIPKDTGSLLYNSEATQNTLTKKLGLNIPIAKFKSQTFQYFRAHPVFIKCAEQTVISLLKNDIVVEILRGYITSSESTGNDLLDKYHQSGSAIELGIVGDNGNVEDIAGAVLKVCPAILERELRDLGLVIKANSVHFRMSESDAPGPSYNTDGYNGIGDIGSWVEGKINEGLEPLASSACENFATLDSGDQYPEGKTQEQIVGTLDTKITRNMTKDFKRLVQYQGSAIKFQNSEGGAAWCDVTGATCPATCANKIQGNSAANRCADRVMSSRLLGVLNKLAKKVRVVLGDTLKVIEAWDESYEGNENGDTTEDLLHYEGRAAELHVVSGDDTKLGDVAKYASCFGADYVKHRGIYVYVSVKRMKTGGSRTTFPNIDLLSVDVPEAVEHLYSLPSVFTEKEAASYPLFDKSGKEDTYLATGIKLGQFASKDNRYFRLNPKLVECYRDVIYSENQRKAEGVPDVQIEVTRGFLTNRENQRKFDVASDGRYNTHNRGMAMQIRYRNATQSSVYTPHRLLYKVIDKCAARFNQIKMEMGVGLYPDSVFVDIRPHYSLMTASLNQRPSDSDEHTFEAAIEDRYYLAKNKRVVDPDDYTTACLFQTAPKPQSSAFVHEHSEVVKRKRRKRRSTVEEGCIPTENTEFCGITKPHREKVVSKIASTLDRKHYSERPREEIMNALNGCFLSCGTCLEGSIYEEKTYHCNNFLHWVNWTMLNDQPDISNIFVSLTGHACEDGSHCVENSPLFSLVAPSYWKIFRPDPARSVEEFLYSPANNPSPVMALLEDIYLIQASGRVGIWVKDDTEMTAIKRQLEVAMLYNKDVTHINIYIEKYNLTKDAVTGIVEKAARTMTTQGCPDVTRVALTPYSIHPIPTAKRKRAAEAPSLRYELRKRHYDIDANWMKKNRYF